MSLPSGDADLCTMAMDYIKSEGVNNLTPAKKDIEAVCERWVEPSKRLVLSSFPYNFAKTRATLLRNTAAVPCGYADSYELPNDFLLLTFINDESLPLTQIPFAFEGEDILIDNGGANSLNIGYVRYIDNIAKYPILVTKLVALEIAENVVFQVTGKGSLLNIITQRKQAAMIQARTVNGFNQPQRTYRSSSVLGNARLNTSNRAYNTKGQVL